MRKYCITSPQFVGEIYYTFDSLGRLLSMELVGVEEYSTVERIAKTCPPNEAVIVGWRNYHGTKLTVTEVQPDLSFETFYKAYNYKVGKKEAESAWKRLSDAKKIKAITQIAKYNHWLGEKGIAKAYASTYLNKERFEDDFK